MPAFKDDNQGQGILNASRPNDCTGSDFSARVIDQVIEMLALKEIYADCAEENNPSYHPQMVMGKEVRLAK